MHRLFAAIRPPAEIREKLLSIVEGIRGARWQDDGQLHLTLRFIGEVERHQAEDIALALGQVRHPPFEIALDGIGQFDGNGARGGLWVGVTPHDALRHLHKAVDSALRRAGVPPEGRAYLPHITIARLNSSSGPVSDFVAVQGTIASAPFAVDSFCLYESFLSAGGARYEIVERYPLLS